MVLTWVGAQQMSGNVWEWVSTILLYNDFSDDFPYPYATDDGREDSNNRIDAVRVFRGGSFADPSGFSRSASRFGFDPDEDSFNFGFRCARDFGE